MVPVEGTEEAIPADLVLIAAGFLGSQKYVTDAFKVATTPRTNVETKLEAYETSVPRVFTAGDMHRGQSLVVWAIREGREALRQWTNLNGLLLSVKNIDTKNLQMRISGDFFASKTQIEAGNPQAAGSTHCVLSRHTGIPTGFWCGDERTAYEPENPETISVKTREKEEAKDLTLSYAGAAVLVLILVIGLLAAGIRKRKKKKFSCSFRNQMWK